MTIRFFLVSVFTFIWVMNQHDSPKFYFLHFVWTLITAYTVYFFFYSSTAWTGIFGDFLYISEFYCLIFHDCIIWLKYNHNFNVNPYISVKSVVSLYLCNVMSNTCRNIKHQMKKNEKTKNKKNTLFPTINTLLYNTINYCITLYKSVYCGSSI